MAVEEQAARPNIEPDRDQVDFSWFTDWARKRAERSPRFARLGPGAEWTGLAVALFAAVLLGLWLTAGAWGPRPPSGEDTIPHLLRAQFALRNLLPHFRIDGWDPTFILGYQEFLFIGPGLTWAVGLVRVLSFGLLSVAGAFKVVFIGSFVVLPLSVAFFGRSFGLSRRASGLAAILTLAVNNPFGGVGLQGLFNVGLAVHQFGAIFFFLTLGCVLRLIQTPRMRWVIATGAAGAALLVSHGISVILLAPLLLIVLIVHLTPTTSEELRKARFEAIVRREVQAELRRREPKPAEPAGTATARTVTADPAAEATAAEATAATANERPAAAEEADVDAAVAETPGDAPASGRPEPAPAEADPDSPEDELDLPEPQRPDVNFRRLALAAGVAAALAACILLPFLVHRNLRGGFTGWGTVTFGERITQIWRGEIMFRPGVAWIVLAGLAYGLYRAYQGKQYALAMVAAPIIYLAVSHAALHLWPTNVAAVQLPNRGVGYVGVLAMLPLAALIDRLGSTLPLGGFVAIGLALAVVILPLGASRDMAREQGEAVPALVEAAAELKRLVPDGARFVTERDFPREIQRTGIINPDRWLAWAAGRNTLNNFNVESSAAGLPAFEAEHIRDRSPEAIADSLSRLGTTHLVTLSDEAYAAISASPRFVEVWSSTPVAIFTVLPKPGQPDPSALLTADVPVAARLTEAEPEAVDIEFQAGQAGRANVAIAWSPKWHAEIDGRSVPVFRAADGLIELDMPAGDHRLSLRFRPDIWDRLGVLVSLVTAIAIGVWVVRTFRRQRRQHGEPPAEDEPGPGPDPEPEPAGAEESTPAV